MRKTDLAYFAGILDGEGTITLAKTQLSSPNQRQTYFVRVQVVNTNEWLCQQLRFAFGGSVALHRKTEGSWKPAYRWLGTKDVAYRFLKAILPYLHLKRLLAELAIEFIEHKTSGGHKTQEYIDFEADYKKNFLQLNKRGK